MNITETLAEFVASVQYLPQGQAVWNQYAMWSVRAMARDVLQRQDDPHRVKA